MGNDILIKSNRDPLFGMTRNEYISKLKEKLAGRIDEAYFFGSFTGSEFGKHSDIDIILVCPTDKPFHVRAVDFEDLLDLVPSTDILVYTHDELERLTAEESVGFWKSVKESMVRFV
jgi:predicted nucleotidyltransferase